MSRAAICPRRTWVSYPGFTIVEMLIASTILVVALLGIAGVLPVANLTLHQSGQISKAVSLAQEMIEMIKNDSFADLTLYNNVDTRTTGTYPVDDAVTPGAVGNFVGGTNVTKWKDDINVFLVTGAGITNGYGTIVVTNVATDASAAAILRKVTVRVHWTEQGRPYQVMLETLASSI
jgi:prepilin-type N-terminal cleavage/methylation domain-containing protein